MGLADSEWWLIPAKEAEELIVGLASLGIDPDAKLTVTPYAESEDAMPETDCQVIREGLEFLQVAGAVKYRIARIAK